MSKRTANYISDSEGDDDDDHVAQMPRWEQPPPPLPEEEAEEVNEEENEAVHQEENEAVHQEEDEELAAPLPASGLPSIPEFGSGSTLDQFAPPLPLEEIPRLCSYEKLLAARVYARCAAKEMENMQISLKGVPKYYNKYFNQVCECLKLIAQVRDDLYGDALRETFNDL